MSTEGGTKVATIVGILIGAGLLIAAGAVAVLRLDHVRDAQERAALEREHRQMVEEQVQRERQLRAVAENARFDAEAAAREAREARIAPMPREKATDPAVLERQKRDAHRGCQIVSQAVEAYALHPNAGNTRDECLPKSIRDLLNPPWGGPSYLKNRDADTIDPWGRPYQFEPHQYPDGTATVLVITFGPDKVPISQFGIGDKARPRK